ncbi:MAG: PAS domain S-box protein [Solidesulfovibrio sp.]|uniref:PAS domain S-box protein n=1 Tax=Solidesulfovibrio sp. TaxID=2910990 RepID=UPI0031598A96
MTVPGHQAPPRDDRHPPMPVCGDCRSMAVALLALCGLGLLDYPAFHILSELGCLAAGTAAFLVIWNTRAFVEHGFFLVFAAAFLAASGYGALHILGVLGLARFPLPATAIDSIRAAGPLGLAASLCLGTWLSPGRTFTPGATLVAVVGGNAALGLSLALATAAMPASGAAIVAVAHAATLAFLAATALFRGRLGLGSRLAAPLVATLACLALAEAAFCLAGPGIWPGLVGQAAKLLGYWLGCRMAVVTGVDRPHERLRDEIRRRERELAARMVRLGAQARAIYDLAGLPSLEDGDFTAFATALVEKSMAVLGVGRAGVWLLSPDDDRLICRIAGGAARADEGSSLGRADAPGYFEALAHERLLVVNAIEASPLTRPLAETYLAPRGIVSLLDAPLRFSGRPAGVLKLEHTGTPRRFADDEQAFAGSAADLLALAMEAAERRQAARELAESELRLRSLVEAMPDPICFKDADGRWIVANQAMLDTFGLSPGTWRGLTNAELAERFGVDTGMLEIASASDHRVWASRETNAFGLSLPLPDGRERHFDVIRAPLYHANGQPKGLVSVWRDVTASRDALLRLRESNQELEAIYNETSDGLVIADVGNRAIVRVNAAACRMFGYAPKALTALSPWDLHPLEERRRSLEQFGAIVAGRLRLLEGIPCRRADGTVFFADISAQPITYGGRTAILGFYRDISERRQAEEALKSSEARFRRVFNGTYDAIFLHAEDGGIIDVNDKALELYGVRRDEAAAFSLERDYSAEDNPADKLHTFWREVMAGQDRFFEWKARRPHDGSVFYVEVYLRRLDLAGRPVILANVRDVTERKRVLAALAARQEEISALNRDLADRVREETEKNRQKDILLLNRTRLAAMGEMIGNIAHQWRQPLNALSILLANMRFEYEAACEAESPELLASHATAGEILRKMSATIDDFRNFFKPDKQREAFAVVEAIGDALLLIEASLIQHGVKVRFTARKNPRVFGFRGEFSQVMLNLLGNAKDAILASRRTGGQLAIRVMERHGRAVVAVTDNGGGIPEAALPRIFDPYFTTKAETGGTGLGLYMSKIIIEEHMQGSLTAANTEGGTRFSVRVPLAPASPPAIANRTP